MPKKGRFYKINNAKIQNIKKEIVNPLLTDKLEFSNLKNKLLRADRRLKNKPAARRLFNFFKLSVFDNVETYSTPHPSIWKKH